MRVETTSSEGTKMCDKFNFYIYLALVIVMLHGNIDASPLPSKDVLGLALSLRDIGQTADLLLSIGNERVRVCAEQKRQEALQLVDNIMEAERKCVDKECEAFILREATTAAEVLSADLAHCLNNNNNNNNNYYNNNNQGLENVY